MYTDDTIAYDGLTSDDEGNELMILTRELRTSALDAINAAIRDELEAAPGICLWETIKSMADNAAMIAAATVDDEVDSDLEYLITDWADRILVEESRIAEMDQMLTIAVDDFTGDNPEISVDAAWYDLVQSVVINYERDAITAAWIRTKL